MYCGLVEALASGGRVIGRVKVFGYQGGADLICVSILFGYFKRSYSLGGRVIELDSTWRNFFSRRHLLLLINLQIRESEGCIVLPVENSELAYKFSYLL